MAATLESVFTVLFTCSSGCRDLQLMRTLLSERHGHGCHSLRCDILHETSRDHGLTVNNHSVMGIFPPVRPFWVCEHLHTQSTSSLTVHIKASKRLSCSRHKDEKLVDGCIVHQPLSPQLSSPIHISHWTPGAVGVCLHLAQVALGRIESWLKSVDCGG